MDILVSIDIFAGVLLGEALTFYYRFPGIDKFYHFYATAQIALAGFLIPRHFLLKKTIALSLVFAFFFALAVEAMWEIYEFSFDRISESNMQKYVADEIYVAIENGVINLDNAAIAGFYKTLDGYH